MSDFSITHPAGPTARASRRPRWLLISAIAGLAVVALVAGYLITRAVTGADGPETPENLQLKALTGQVEATWDAVADADSYQLLRGDRVVYSGPAPHGIDATVTEGKNIYRVLAIRHGIVSPPSAPVEVSAGPGWGLYAPLMAQYPVLLPQAPDEIAWEGAQCVWMLNGAESERGPSQTGSGDLQTVMRIRCATSNYRNAFGVFWFASKDAVNRSFTAYAPTGQPIRWSHGTGVVDTEQGRAMLKIADDPAHELSVIVIVSTFEKMTVGQIVEFANRMPVQSG
ncbi:fibronectin type III domain-containing protein [Gordonia sp. ABSL1-1]|uniref:fibronectin type III domain-containing protein n=1 Tax=Gordonia sp. ABSL1-1 TaxID=3053923 RepID=UPI002574538A|nr:fibronectin type III domain-containing protein [Gordonia sp. ABSL1-1]MDL9936527.1 fibronectin type III domain-containing protein [Gordonia sp. ABSL1-1]